MASNADTSVQQIQQDFQALIADVTGPDTRTATAYTVELTLFRRLLALGAALLRLFFQTRAAERPAGPVHAPDGTALGDHDGHPCTYYSVFGKVRFARHYVTAAGQEGVYPLDADLSLPARSYSDLLQEWGTYGTTDASYHESHAALAHILGLAVGSAALETMVADAVVDVADFHAQPVRPEVRAADGPLLVVQADGKGVPMVQPPTGARPVRLGKGQKRAKKKEAIVTSLYTIAPYVRTPQEVVAALRQDRDRPPDTVPRPKPVGKELRATLDGKGVALTRLAARARQREGPHIQERVALTDGAEALQQQIAAHFPRHTLVLDIIHATDYLWNAANALRGETHPDRLAWIRTHLAQLLAGDTPAVITALEAAAQDPARTATQRKALLGTAGYDRRNAPYMCYDVYLAHGWPIGTAGPSARGSWKGPAATSSRIAWNRRGCAGPKPGHRRSSISGRSGSTVSGTPMPRSIASGNISGCTGHPTPQRRWRRCRCWLTRPSRAASTDFGHTRLISWLGCQDGWTRRVYLTMVMVSAVGRWPDLLRSGRISQRGTPYADAPPL